MDNRLWSRETWEVRQGGYSGLWLTQGRTLCPSILLVTFWLCRLGQVA